MKSPDFVYGIQVIRTLGLHITASGLLKASKEELLFFGTELVRLGAYLIYVSNIERKKK